MRHSHARGHFVRSVVEYVALQLSAIVSELDRLTPVTEIRATGGVFRSPVWRQVVPGALGHPLTVTGGAEGSALGAAALGLYALGRAESLELALESLAPGLLSVAGERVEVASTDTAIHARMRTAIPALLSSYAAVADLFAPGPRAQRTSTATATPPVRSLVAP